MSSSSSFHLHLLLLLVLRSLLFLLISSSFCDGFSLPSSSSSFLFSFSAFVFSWPPLSSYPVVVSTRQLCLLVVVDRRSSLSVSCVCPTATEPSLGRFGTVSWQCLGPRSLSRPYHGRHSVTAWTCLGSVRSLFGRHFTDCLFTSCPSVLSLPSEHLSLTLIWVTTISYIPKP